MNIRDQISCVEREIKMRKKVYPGLVFREKMSKTEADQEIDTMQNVLKTLQNLDQGELGL